MVYLQSCSVRRFCSYSFIVRPNVCYFLLLAVPENISARAISSVEVHVSWDPVPVPQLTGYMVQYRKVDNNITSQNVTVYDASRSSVVLQGLLPASNYSILVLLVFADRLKNLSNEVFVATKGKWFIGPQLKCVWFVPTVRRTGVSPLKWKLIITVNCLTDEKIVMQFIFFFLKKRPTL